MAIGQRRRFLRPGGQSPARRPCSTKRQTSIAVERCRSSGVRIWCHCESSRWGRRCYVPCTALMGRHHRAVVARECLHFPAMNSFSMTCPSSDYSIHRLTLLNRGPGANETTAVANSEQRKREVRIAIFRQTRRMQGKNAEDGIDSERHDVCELKEIAIHVRYVTMHETEREGVLEYSVEAEYRA